MAIDFSKPLESTFDQETCRAVDYALAMGGSEPEAIEAPMPTVLSTFDLEAIKLAVAPYRQQVKDMVQEATALIVQDEVSNNLANELGNRARTLKKKVEAIKGQPAYSEAYAFVDEVRTLLNEFTKPLEAEIEKPLGKKMAAYADLKRLEEQRIAAAAREEARKQQERIDAEQAAIKAEAERKVKEAAEELRKKEEAGQLSEAERIALQKTIDDETAAALAPAPIIVAPVFTSTPTTTRTSAGGSFAKRPWIFEITDIALVPREYLVVNESAIRRDVAAGIREIPGVRVYQETKINFKK